MLKAIFLVLAFSATFLFADDSIRLRSCFEDCWGMDRNSSAYLIKKLQPLIEQEEHRSVISDFLEKSKSINIDFNVSREIRCLPEEDAVLNAPKHHLVVFENPYVRVLWGSTAAGEREPFHVHAWKSLMFVIKPTTYEIENADGSIEIWEGRVGVYELPPNERYACTNVGASPDEILRFEIKDLN